MWDAFSRTPGSCSRPPALAGRRRDQPLTTSKLLFADSSQTRFPELPARHRPSDGYATSGMMRIATMFATLIIGLMAGPEVSL